MGGHGHNLNRKMIELIPSMLNVGILTNIWAIVGVDRFHAWSIWDV